MPRGAGRSNGPTGQKRWEKRDQTRKIPFFTAWLAPSLSGREPGARSGLCAKRTRGAAGRGLLLPPNPLRFRNPRARLQGRERSRVSGQEHGHGFAPGCPSTEKFLPGLGGSEGEPGERCPCSPVFACCHEVAFRTTAGPLEMAFSPRFYLGARRQHLQGMVTHHLLRCRPRFPGEKGAERLC